MASFFGEIRPLSSRAVDDEESDNQPKYEVYVKNIESSNLNSNIKLAVFSIGEIASVFVKSYFLSEKYVLQSTIEYSCDSNDQDTTFYTGVQNVRKKKAADMFISTSDILICEVSDSVPAEICYKVTELIFKDINPVEVLILTSDHIATFKSECSTSYGMPFLKALVTSHYKKPCNIPRLEPPNFLSNIVASVLLKCEISQLPALCVVNFVDTNAVDSLNVAVFDDVLKEAIISEVPSNTDAKSKVIKYVKSRQCTESYLYL